VLNRNFINTPWKTDEAALLRLYRFVFGALVCALLIASYLPVFSLYARQHWTVVNLQGAYAHAPLSLLLILFLFWRQRLHLSGYKRPSLGTSGLTLLTIGIALKVYGDVQGYVVLQGMSIIPVLLGLIRCYYDTITVRALRFPVLFLFFVVPLPGAAIDALTLPLIKVTAELVTSLLPMFNIDVVKTGHVLTVNADGLAEYHEIILAPECSGIRSFISLLALSCLFANLQGRGFLHAAMLMLATIPLVIVGNCIRVTLTVLMIVKVSPDTAENFFHWSSGLLLFAVTMLGLLVIDSMLMKRIIKRKSADG